MSTNSNEVSPDRDFFPFTSDCDDCAVAALEVIMEEVPDQVFPVAAADFLAKGSQTTFDGAQLLLKFTDIA